MGRKRQTLLWKIQHPDLEGNSYLFGTMHVRDSLAFTYVEQVKPFLTQCEVFAAEMDLDEAQNLSRKEDFLLPDGQTLHDLLSGRRYEKMRRILLKSFGINLAFFTRVLPFYLTNLITESILSRDHQVSLDEYLWTFAGDQGLLRDGIESFHDQMDVLTRFPVEQQMKSLISISRKPEKIRKQLKAITQAYLHGNIHQLYIESKKSLHGFRKILIYERNDRMAQKIGIITGKQTHFIALGAGHLAGEKGLIKLLKRQGLRLNPVLLN
jgi:uncharacterized protein YbaP (TraB family)